MMKIILQYYHDNIIKVDATMIDINKQCILIRRPAYNGKSQCFTIPKGDIKLDYCKQYKIIIFRIDDVNEV